MVTYDVPTMMCYAHADDFINKTKPTRGRGEVRPLGRRRYYHAKWITISTDPNLPKHTIEAGTYNDNVCVRFYADGRIEFLHGWWDIAARQLVSAMFRHRFTCIYANSEKWYLHDMSKHIQYPVRRDKPLMLKCIKKDGFTYEYEGEIVPEQKPYVLMDKYRPILKQYSDFLKYVEVMNKLSGGIYQEGDFPEYAQRQIDLDNALELVAGKTTETASEEFANALNCLIRQCSEHRWHPQRQYVCTTKRMKEYLYGWIKDNHKDTIYEMREVPNSVVVK